MAKKKNEIPVINNKMFCSAEDVLEEENSNVFLPVSPAIDYRLKGGIPSGSVVLVRTLPKVGKTTLAVQIAANALQQGRYVIYVDAERRLEGSKYFNVKNLDTKNKKFLILRAKQGERLISGDEIYTTIKNMMMIPKYRGALYIVDSFSKVIPRSTLEDNEIRADRRDTTPKLNADFCKKAGNLCRISDSIIIGIQHFITDPNAMGDPLKPDGGDKLSYECDIVLESKRKAVMWDGSNINVKSDEQLPGILGRFNIPVNKRGTIYISKDDPIMSYIKFGEGVWWAREALDLLITLGVCYTKGNGRYVFITDAGEVNAHGAEKAVSYIDENREYYENFIRDYMIKEYKISYDFQPPDLDEDEDQE